MDQDGGYPAMHIGFKFIFNSGIGLFWGNYLYP
jgi:hypothetical protein